ncbi:MAG: ribosome small subunit-dependent GTPase A, partial [Chitinophagaceae bacterium]
MKGLVYKSTGSWYLVKADDGKLYEARLKGIFK